jgi:ABC-type antimicrobial peptide transport system permease subunit
VIDQAAWSVGTAAAIAVVAALALAWVLGLVGGVPMTVEPASVLRIAVGAFALGLFGAVVPIIRVSRVDPASVYRR